MFYIWREFWVFVVRFIVFFGIGTAEYPQQAMSDNLPQAHRWRPIIIDTQADRAPNNKIFHSEYFHNRLLKIDISLFKTDGYPLQRNQFKNSLLMAIGSGGRRGCHFGPLMWKVILIGPPHFGHFQTPVLSSR
jgi:hypothetical protein